MNDQLVHHAEILTLKGDSYRRDASVSVAVPEALDLDDGQERRSAG